MRPVLTPVRADSGIKEKLTEKPSLPSVEGRCSFVRQLDGTITSWDPGAKTLYGWNNEDAEGKVSHTLLSTVFPEDLEGINQRLLREGRWAGNLIHTRHDGLLLEVSSHWDLMHDVSGEPIAILESNVPLTEPIPEHSRRNSPLLTYVLYRAPLLAIILMPLYLTAGLWQQLWQAVRVGAWDGTGHYAAAEIYSKSIFPDTFGWMHAYFSGMPFPNFYPPLFHWCVALLHHTGLFSFATSFKIMIALPTLLVPVAVWMLARRVSENNYVVATAASLATVPLLVHWRFQVPFGGLDYFNTFQVGLYTQPLGFILLVFWFLAYLDAHRDRKRFALAAVLLGLAILGSFFAAMTAGLFMIAVAGCDLIQYTTIPTEERPKRLREFTTRIASAAVGLVLISFWLVPMISAYEVFTSHPVSWYVIPRGMWAWYGVALIGVAFWLRRQSYAMRTFLLGAVFLATIIVIGGVLAPRWFPIQPFRLVPIFNFLLAVPVGYAVATLTSGVWSVFKRTLKVDVSPMHRDVASVLAITAIGIIGSVLVFLVTEPRKYDLAFYLPGSDDTKLLDDILSFAEANPNGRYLVEPILYKEGASNVNEAFASGALNQYLGTRAGGGFNGLYSEASPHRLFFGPQANVLARQQKVPSTMGSALGSNDEFFDQPLRHHLERLRRLGIRYFVIHSPEIKARLGDGNFVTLRESFQEWSVYELNQEPAPAAIPLDYLPALVVGNFSFKERQAAQYDFVRLTEEQFAEGWFDVLLTLAAETSIDRIGELERFGALILDTYEYDNQEQALAVLREFSRDRALILLESDAPLFQRMRESMNEFPGARIIARSLDPVERLTSLESFATHPESLAIREDWREIRSILDQQKIPVKSKDISTELGPTTLQIESGTTNKSETVPVLLNVSFHPNWRRADGGALYPATPFLMVTFVNDSVTLVFSRRWHEKLALVISAVTLVVLVGFVAWPYRKRLRSLKGRVNRLP